MTRETNRRREGPEDAAGAAGAPVAPVPPPDVESSPPGAACGAPPLPGLAPCPAGMGRGSAGASAVRAVPASAVLARRSRMRRSTGRTSSPASTASSRYKESATHRNPGQESVCWSQKGAWAFSATKAPTASTQPPVISTAPARRIAHGRRVVSRNSRRQMYQLPVTRTARTKSAMRTKTMVTVRSSLVPYDVERDAVREVRLSARRPRNPMPPMTVPHTKETTASVR